MYESGANTQVIPCTCARWSDCAFCACSKTPFRLTQPLCFLSSFLNDIYTYRCIVISLYRWCPNITKESRNELCACFSTFLSISAIHFSKGLGVQETRQEVTKIVEILPYPDPLTYNLRYCFLLKLASWLMGSRIYLTGLSPLKYIYYP